MPKITAIIPTYNEESNIRPLLSSLDWVNEIIVVDSFSTDNTVSIAQEFNIRLLQREYMNSANQKNWTIPQARYSWILLLDADERLTPELLEELQAFQQKDGSAVEEDGYWIGRQIFFMGQKIKYSGWRRDRVIRLFRRDKCRYSDKQVHAEIITKDRILGQLNAKLEHYTYRNLNHFLAKMERYSDWAAQDYFQKTPKVGLFHLGFKPVARFLKHYLWQGGFLDGRVGFIISILMAWGVFLRYAKVRELQLEKTPKP